MRRAMIILPLVALVLTAVSGSAAFLDLGDASAQASRHQVSVGPIGHCATLPAEVVCIEVPPPSAPTLLGCDSGTLQWDESLTAARYHIYHSVLSIGPEQLGSVPNEQTDYGLRPSLLVHRYHLTASNIGGESKPSATIAAQCAPAEATYSGPHALGASTLLAPTFEAALAGPADETETPEGDGGDEAMRLDGITLALARSLAPAAPEDGAGEDEPTEEATPEPTSEPKPDTTPPVIELPPTRIVELSWARDGRSLLYVVLRSTTPGGPYAQVGVIEDGSTLTDEVATAATYYYVVVGVDAAGVESSPSAEIVSPGITLPPVVKAPKPLTPTPECPEDSDEAVLVEGEDGELVCAIPTATPSPTPSPTATPSPTPTAAASPSPTPVATSAASAGGSEPSPTPAPTPVSTSTPEATPEPTSTPEATPAPTPEPTPTEEPAAEPQATAEPSPEASPEPEGTPPLE